MIAISIKQASIVRLPRLGSFRVSYVLSQIGCRRLASGKGTTWISIQAAGIAAAKTKERKAIAKWPRPLPGAMRST